jgi:hypothetical protein
MTSGIGEPHSKRRFDEYFFHVPIRRTVRLRNAHLRIAGYPGKVSIADHNQCGRRKNHFKKKSDAYSKRDIDLENLESMSRGTEL